MAPVILMASQEEELRKIISDDMKSLGWEDDIIPDSNSSIN